MGDMAALVYEGQQRLAVQRREVPEPDSHQVLVEVSRCGICGTDLHLVLEDYARPGSVLGHEWSGRIATLGADVTGWSVGDRVTAGPARGCGECRPCRRGRPSVCLERPPTDYSSYIGAYAHYLVADAARLVAIPDSVDDRAAALAEPLAVVLHAVTLAQLEEGDRVLITGAGPLGLLLTAVLAADGVTHITVSEPSALRRTQALEVGATSVIEPADLPEPPMGAPVEKPVDVAFDCSGQPDAISAAIGQLAPAGTMVVLGTGVPETPLNHNRMIVQETTVLGVVNYDEGGFEAALTLLAGDRLPLEALIDPDDVALEQVRDAITACAAGERRAKVLVNPGATP